MSHPLGLESVHSLWSSREEVSPGAALESGRGGPGFLIPYQSHNLSRANLPSMDGAVNATLHGPLEGEETVWG